MLSPSFLNSAMCFELDIYISYFTRIILFIVIHNYLIVFVDFILELISTNRQSRSYKLMMFLILFGFFLRVYTFPNENMQNIEGLAYLTKHMIFCAIACR